MTPKELWDHYTDDAEEIEEKTLHVDDHGGEDIELVLKLPDGRLFQVNYHNGRGGDYNSWRDGDLSLSDIEEVEAYTETVTVTKYRKVGP